jgi:hypothetical protein
MKQKQMQPTDMNMIEMIKTIALAMNAKTVSLIDNKKYRFYLFDERIIDIPKKELEIEYLDTVELNIMH